MDLNKLTDTPVQRIDEKLNNNTLYIKRDDLLPTSFGGNKARKASYFFRDLIQKECDCIVTYGSSSSNHCRVIANIAASEKIPCYIISPSESNHLTFNSKIINLFNAKVTNCSISDVKVTIDRKLGELNDKGYKPYFIEGGGHGNLGTKAYIDAYDEILRFENITDVHFDYIFHTSGTGTTQAGLVVGNVLNGDDREIIGISNARKNPYGRQVVLESVNTYLKSINENSVKENIIKFIDEYVLEGYGDFNDHILNTLEDMMKNEGIPMDTTYTAKGYWGMKEYIKKNHINSKNILFIHTGGTPLFFDSLGEISNE
ncbi:1-aminocyclopropane-1-carboxylate deaminase/D-cysteine desulfhydrase [Halobacillus sp. H74]|uniref:1-aminocyclopropane-1-carboxylate deaminase/D-cysteine desulfhydrase n=1 Tax=Halobacillus sp. H74 TaxID=3457436 RepID=UPI003FCDDA77